MSYGDLFVSGALTGFAVAFVEGPVDLVKSQLQVNHKDYNGFVDCARKVVGTYGVRGVYQVRTCRARASVPHDANLFVFSIRVLVRR